MAPRLNIGFLRRQLDSNMVVSELGHHFLPTATVATILTRPAVREALLELDCQPDERLGLEGDVWQYGRKVFAILILMREEDHIVEFRHHGALDDRLPLSQDEASRVAGDIGSSFASQYQWRLLPRHFPERMWEHHVEFRNQDILPFVGEPIYLTKGGFGEIYRVEILPSQQALLPSDGKEVHVIKKKLKSKEMTEAVQHERMCLRLLNQLQHPNIIRLLGSYTYRGEHNFIFPCLDMDLEAFLQRDDRYGQFQHDVTFFAALRGLSSALSKTHQLHLSQECHGVDFEAIGYHHDLRPKNVLVSKETLVLADFGLGNLKTAEDQSMTTWKPTTGDYLAPECMDSKMRRQDVNRAIDVWAFGCLVAEVVTYMTKGSKGVKEFRARRLTPGRASGWSDSGFYHPDGHVKDEVTAWLDGITQDCLGKSILPSLVKLLLMALAKDPTHRPKISSICQTLTFLSLKAHFSAVHQQLLDLESQKSQHESCRANIWFLRQRLCAWGLALALDKDSASVDLTAFLDQMYDQAIVKMVALFHMLKGSPEGQVLADADARSIIEPEIDQLVEGLWNLLPTKVRGQAEDYWHQAVLSTDSPDEIEGVYNTLKSRYTVYDIAGAMALMKKFQLGTLHPGSIQSVGKPCRLSWDDIKLNSSSGAGHVFGRHQDQKPVLVEEFTFTSHRVEPTQRTLVLDLKAKSLSVDPKPQGLRTLKCLGALEANSSRGYGLVFEYPEGEESTPTTLLQYLILGEKSTRGHPFLGNRFKLAFSLADFFKEFHSIGWMHEAFNARNVLFFQSLDASGRRTLQLENPYIVGLHRTRPDGSFWQTDGPMYDESDYQHPEYGRTGRYRLVFDYYSLGVVLLEIGLWCPLQKMLSSQRFRAMGSAEISSALIELAETALGSKMGAVYRDLVVLCMSGSLEASAQGRPVRADLLRHFSEAVVEPLRRLASAPI